MVRRCIALTAIALSLMLGACAAPGPSVERYSPPAPGFSWVNRQRDSGSFGEGESRFANTRTERSWQGRPVISIDSLGGSLLIDPNLGAYLAIADEQGKPLISWDPPWGLDFPMRIGKTWERSHRVLSHASGRSTPYRVRCAVEAHEDIEVAAGRFKAFRIACTNSLGTDETYWFSPQLGINLKQRQIRSSRNVSGEGVREVELESIQEPPPR